MNPYIVGPSIGFTYFLLNTATVEKVYVRPDENNNNRFTLRNLWGFIKTPLQIGTQPCKILWGAIPDASLKDRLKMLQLNWVMMTALGGLGSMTYIYFTH